MQRIFAINCSGDWDDGGTGPAGRPRCYSAGCAARALADRRGAYVFGSRAHGGARRFADLDLALEWDKPLGLDIISRIAEALSESDLPYKVDIVDLATTEPAFRARIAADRIPLDVLSHERSR
jgi:uncharacterized protein